MALSRSSATGYVSGGSHGTGSFASGSFTPGNNSLLVACVIAHTLSVADLETNLSLSNSAGLTFTQRATRDQDYWGTVGVKLWTAPVTTGASMTVTADCGAVDVYGYRIVVFWYTGHNTTTPTGATGSNGEEPASGALSLTLSAAPASDSEVIGLIGVQDATTITANAGGGWSEIFEALGGAEPFLGAGVMVRTGSTSTTVDWTAADTAEDGGSAAIGVEIKAAGAAVSSRPIFRRPTRFFQRRF